MNKHRIHALTLAATLAALAGCSTIPDKHTQLESARSDYRTAQADPQVQELAAPELKLAGEAVSKADASWMERDSNQALSTRRADSVRTALLGMGVGGERVSAHGYGEAYPVASNGAADGKQLNRRVEIILSDDSGTIAPR